MSEQTSHPPPSDVRASDRIGIASTAARVTASDASPSASHTSPAPAPEVQPAATGPDVAGGKRRGNHALVRLYWHLTLTGFVTFAGFGVALVVARVAGHSDLMLLVLLAGSTGAVINNYYRLARLSAVDHDAFDRFDNHVFTMQLYVSVLISGVLGFLMYGLCISGLVAGDLFPAFKGVNAGYASVTELLANVSPAGNIDAVKAVVWAFIAGFSEKLIPNMIDRMAERAEAKSG